MKTHQSTAKYGGIVVFSFIIAAVIGIGIELKANTVMNLTHSAYLTVLAFGLIAAVSFCLVYSFIEISSSTIQGDAEQGTLSNWGSKFHNRKYGSLIGYFTVFVYVPLTVITLAIFSSRIFLNIFVDRIASMGVWVDSNPAQYALAVILLSFAILTFFTVVNTYSVKFSQKLQVFGTVFKVLPLSLICLIMIVTLITRDPNAVDINGNPIFEGGYNGNWSSINETAVPEGEVSEVNYGGFFLALPAIMFCFDGFVYAGSLQNETKSKNTFSKALTAAVIVVIIIYLLTIVLSVSVGYQSHYSVPDLITVIFGTEGWGQVMSVLFLFFIIISGITALNSFFIFGTRNLNEMAVNGLIPDKGGKIAKETEKGTFPGSIKWMAVTLAVYMGLMIIIDGALTPWDEMGYIATTHEGGVYSEGAWQEYIATPGYEKATVSITQNFGNIIISSADLCVMLQFLVYATIMIGALINRKTNRVRVDKQKGFHFFSIVAIILILFIVSTYFLSLPSGYIAGSDGEANLAPDTVNYGSFYAPVFSIIFVFIIIMVWVGITVTRAKRGTDKGPDKMDNDHLESTITSLKWAATKDALEGKKEWSAKRSREVKFIHPNEGETSKKPIFTKPSEQNVDYLESTIAIYDPNSHVKRAKPHVKYTNLDQVPYQTNFDYTAESIEEAKRIEKAEAKKAKSNSASTNLVKKDMGKNKK